MRGLLVKRFGLNSVTKPTQSAPTARSGFGAKRVRSILTEDVVGRNQATCGHTVDRDCDQGQGADDNQEVEPRVAAQVAFEVQDHPAVLALLGFQTASARTLSVALRDLCEFGSFAKLVRGRKLLRRKFSAKLLLGFGANVH